MVQAGPRTQLSIIFWQTHQRWKVSLMVWSCAYLRNKLVRFTCDLSTNINVAIQCNEETSEMLSWSCNCNMT